MGVLARVPLHCFPPRLSAGSPLTSLLVHRAAVRRLLEPAAAMADGQQHGVATAAAPASVREEKQAARKAIKAALKGLTKDIMYAESECQLGLCSIVAMEELARMHHDGGSSHDLSWWFE